jgi:hypothetical protein
MESGQMTVESGSTFFSNTWALINALVSGNVPDPQTRNSIWIYGDFPDTEGNNFHGYPIITIGNPKSSVSQLSWTTNSLMNNSINISVTAYSKTSKELNPINEKIYNAMKDNELVFAQSGLNFDNITPGADGVDIIGNQRIHWNEQIINMRRVSL